MAMKTVKVAEATGAALDWLVASIEYPNDTEVKEPELAMPESYAFSTDWSEGGPLLDKYDVRSHGIRPGIESWIPNTANKVFGPNLLVSGMRCIVTFVLGETAEVPEELVS